MAEPKQSSLSGNTYSLMNRYVINFMDLWVFFFLFMVYSFDLWFLEILILFDLSNLVFLYVSL